MEKENRRLQKSPEQLVATREKRHEKLRMCESEACGKGHYIRTELNMGNILSIDVCNVCEDKIVNRKDEKSKQTEETVRKTEDEGS